MANELGSKVVQYFCFKKVESCFGFLHLAKVEKNGYEIPKINFNLQKNSLIDGLRWKKSSRLLIIMKLLTMIIC